MCVGGGGAAGYGGWGHYAPTGRQHARCGQKETCTPAADCNGRHCLQQVSGSHRHPTHSAAPLDDPPHCHSPTRMSTHPHPPRPQVRQYKRRILNIHPALLPSFGGKGYYGQRVHSAVVASGARFSGPTIHFVDEEYDTGGWVD